MKYTLMLLTSLIVILTGCRTPGHIGEGEPAKLSVGMTKEEVFGKIGKPETVTSDSGAEILGYSVERPWGQRSQFRVKIVNGKVQSYEVTDHK